MRCAAEEKFATVIYRTAEVDSKTRGLCGLYLIIKSKKASVSTKDYLFTSVEGEYFAPKGKLSFCCVTILNYPHATWRKRPLQDQILNPLHAEHLMNERTCNYFSHFN